MQTQKTRFGGIAVVFLAVLGLILGGMASVSHAAPPVVKTVPWVANSPLIPHDTWSGKTITVKGTSDVYGANITYIWDFGDGSPVVSDTVATVANSYAIEATHAYSAPTGTVFTATLTVTNTTTGESASKQYYVKIEDKTLPVEVNVAIDEGLWALHKSQTRTGSNGSWSSRSGYYSNWAASVNAFEVNGHVESGDPNNPYVETVQRGMRTLFTCLAATGIGAQALGNPDTNGNGLGIRVNQGNQLYQGGMAMDAIVASGTPDAVATTGPTNVTGRTYKAIVQDMLDYYAYAQYDNINLGGWRYDVNQGPDNSACQWAAIGLIAAERNWGLAVPAWVKDSNKNWLTYSQNSSTGWFGYTNNAYIWGPFATTPSGMVQLVMDGLGRGDTRWDKAETFIRNNWDGGGYPAPLKTNNYYGMFSFTKSMLLHQPAITMLHSSSVGVPDLDWYAAETAKGAPSDGVARALVNAQAATGHWTGHNAYTSEAFPFETPWAIIMLQRTLFEAGSPVAVAKANPNPAVAGQIIQLDGSDSYHQDASKLIDSWDWDLDDDGDFDDASGPFPTVSFPAVGNYPVKLRVTDNGSPEKAAETILTILVTIPPIAPTANAGGPYNFCPGAQPWFLDGSGSTNPDEGVSEPGQPGDTIISYEWDLDGDGQYDDAVGTQPDVTAFFVGKGPGSYLIQLRVTDNTAVSFPSSGFGNLVDTDSTVVVVRSSTDPECACVNNLTARAKPGKVQLTWTYTGAHHYNVYRGTISGGPYLKIASTTSTYSLYIDYAVVNGTTYYYVLREADFLDREFCQSNQASARPVSR